MAEAVLESAHQALPGAVNHESIVVAETTSNFVSNIEQLPSNVPMAVNTVTTGVDANANITQAAAMKVISNVSSNANDQGMQDLLNQPSGVNPGIKGKMANWFNNIKESAKQNPILDAAYRHRVVIGATIAVAAVIIGVIMCITVTINLIRKISKKNVVFY